jgi:hypothetical protein
MSFQTGSIDKNGLARTEDGKLYVTSVGTASITGGTITGTNVPYVAAQWAIPFIQISSGSIGDNGALTGVTALPTTYSGGAWCYYPAAAISAGSSAGWYWTVFSSTTAGTIYNSTYTSGIPGIGTTTAFATTGPGAFTGDTTQRIGPVIATAANAMGPNGSIVAGGAMTGTSSASAKTLRFSWPSGGTTVNAIAITNGLAAAGEVIVQNKGVTGSQLVTGIVLYNASLSTVPQYTSIDTTSARSVGFSLQKALATDNAILENGYVKIAYGA